MPFECVQINPNFKKLLSDWSAFQNGLIFYVLKRQKKLTFKLNFSLVLDALFLLFLSIEFFQKILHFCLLASFKKLQLNFLI
jgi:hypothetical protein